MDDLEGEVARSGIAQRTHRFGLFDIRRLERRRAGFAAEIGGEAQGVDTDAAAAAQLVGQLDGDALQRRLGDAHVAVGVEGHFLRGDVAERADAGPIAQCAGLQQVVGDPYEGKGRDPKCVAELGLGDLEQWLDLLVADGTVHGDGVQESIEV